MAERNQWGDKRLSEALPDPAELHRSPHHKKRAAFLAAYAQCGSTVQAARVAGCDRASHYKVWMKDPQYAEAFANARDEATDRLVAEARRRAVEGVPEPVGWYKGKPGGTIQRYSDNLLMFLIKAARPEYRDSARVDLHPHAPGDGDPTGAGERELDALLREYGIIKPDAGPKADEPDPADPAADCAAGPIP